MLRSGCTSVFELFGSFPMADVESARAVAKAYTDLGMRALIAPMLSDIGFSDTVPFLERYVPEDLRDAAGFGKREDARRALELLEALLTNFQGDGNGRINWAVAPLSPGDCSDELLEGCFELSTRFDSICHVHIAETRIQVANARRRWGKSMVRHLDDMGGINDKFVAAHGVWLEPAELDILAQKGAKVAHNPISNLKLGSGIAPVREMLDLGLEVGLGCDGSTQSDNQNMFEVMRVAGMLGNLRFPYRTGKWITAEESFSMATIGGAALTGQARKLGRIEEGYRADLVLLELRTGYLSPPNNMTSGLVFSETGSDVRSVIVDGRVVLRDGRVLGLDEVAIHEAARDAASAILARARSGLAVAQDLEPFLEQAVQRTLGGCGCRGGY